MNSLVNRKYGILIAAALLLSIWPFLPRAHHLAEGFAAVAALCVGAPLTLFSMPALDTETLAPLIAIVGCDGSGKTTLVGNMTLALQSNVRVAQCYLGLGSGEMGERIKRWPLIGRALEARLAAKAARARTKGDKIPGVITALVLFGFSLARLRRFRRVLDLRRRGIAVITDRYPQTEIAGFYDGPGLSAARAGGPAVAWLARLEKRMYVMMAGYRPDLVIRLNVDVETAYRRKPEHKLDSLRAKVAATPMLRFNGARIVDLDSCAPYADVEFQALEHIRQLLDKAPRSALSAA